jgi:AraC-like DNA-binding protein
MELKQAAQELGISTRHLHRLIRMNALPARKITVQQVITNQVWDIDDEAIQSAKELLEDLNRDPDHFGYWALKWVERLAIPIERLAQMTKIKKDKLFYILQRPGYTTDEYDGLTRGDPTIPIIGALLREYVRQEYKRRSEA